MCGDFELSGGVEWVAFNRKTLNASPSLLFYFILYIYIFLGSKTYLKERLFFSENSLQIAPPGSFSFLFPRTI